jgi:hypothetical protein
VLARYARNRRLSDAVHQWAFCALKGSPGACAYYDALRQLSNRLVGILHGCLKTGTRYDEATAWGKSPASLLTTKTWDVCRVACASNVTRAKPCRPLIFSGPTANPVA